MKDPRRLLEDAALSDVERRSLSAARTVEPPPELASEVWTDLVMAVGAAGAASSVAAAAARASAKAASGASVSASAGAKVAVIKALALGATLGAITTGGAIALTSPPRRAPEPSVGPSAGADTAVSRNHERDVVTPAVQSPAPESATPRATGTETPVGTRPRDGAHSVAPSGLRPAPATAVSDGVEAKAPPANDGAEAARAEARLVGVAREALQHGDAQRALVVLEDTQRRFPDGILLQEREAVSISALAAVGRKAEAASRASIFLRAFPNSPHTERVLAALRTR